MYRSIDFFIPQLPTPKKNTTHIPRNNKKKKLKKKGEKDIRWLFTLRADYQLLPTVKTPRCNKCLLGGDGGWCGRGERRIISSSYSGNPLQPGSGRFLTPVLTAVAYDGTLHRALSCSSSGGEGGCDCCCCPPSAISGGECHRRDDSSGRRCKAGCC